MSAHPLPTGVHPVLFTFFDDQGEVDLKTHETQVELCLGAGANGVALFGFVGQFFRLTVDEKLALIKTTIEVAGPDIPVGVTAAEFALPDCVRLIRSAETLGASWIVLQPAARFPVPMPSWIETFVALAGQTALPVAIQNAPETGAMLNTADLISLSEAAPNIRIVKNEGPTIRSLPVLDDLPANMIALSGQFARDQVVQQLAGAKGIIPAPTFVDLHVEINGLLSENSDASIAEARRLHACILPFLDFATSTAHVEQSVLYHKRLFAARASLGPEVLSERMPMPMLNLAINKEIDRFAAAFPNFESR